GAVPGPSAAGRPAPARRSSSPVHPRITPMADAVEAFWAVVPAGGAGTRLWPLSRAASPKFLHDLTGSGRTLLQATVDRLLPLGGERILLVPGAADQPP